MPNAPPGARYSTVANSVFVEYAQVVKMLGNGRLEAQCFDGNRRLAHIRGKLRKKVWINQGDIILLSLRDYQDEKGDVILKVRDTLNSPESPLITQLTPLIVHRRRSAFPQSLWRTSRERQNQRDRYVRRPG